MVITMGWNARLDCADRVRQLDGQAFVREGRVSVEDLGPQRAAWDVLLTQSRSLPRFCARGGWERQRAPFRSRSPTGVIASSVTTRPIVSATSVSSLCGSLRPATSPLSAHATWLGGLGTDLMLLAKAQ